MNFISFKNILVNLQSQGVTKLKKKEKAEKRAKGKMMLSYLIIFIVGYVFCYFIHRKSTSFKNQDFVMVTKLSVDGDMDSYFEDIMIPTVDLKPLGKYSDPVEVKQLYFRNSLAKSNYDLHPAPKQQFIIYLSGKAEITTSKGEKRIFKSGDILLAADMVGKGHISNILEAGQAIIVTLE